MRTMTELYEDEFKLYTRETWIEYHQKLSATYWKNRVKELKERWINNTGIEAC